jgi:hypothetical protein
MRLAILSVLMFFFNSAYANAVIGVVEQSTGIVKVKGKDSFKKTSVKAGYEIKEGDLLSTLKDAKAVLKLSDDSDVILSDNSSINFISATNAEQVSGKIFYKITSRDAKDSLKIKTPFAIIGIKGTTFVVNSDKGSESVALKEGLIGISSIKKEFALYRKEVLAAFVNYASEQMSEFEKFKHPEREPKPEVTKEFDLEEGNVISFSENTVKESAWNKNDDEVFAEFEKLITEVIEEMDDANLSDLEDINISI